MEEHRTGHPVAARVTSVAVISTTFSVVMPLSLEVFPSHLPYIEGLKKHRCHRRLHQIFSLKRIILASKISAHQMSSLADWPFRTRKWSERFSRATPCNSPCEQEIMTTSSSARVFSARFPLSHFDQCHPRFHFKHDPAQGGRPS